MSRDALNLIDDVRRVREALALRGFSVRSLHNRLLPGPGATGREWRDMEWALREAGVAFRPVAGSMAILDVPAPDAAVRTIRLLRPHRVMPKPMWYDASWKTFTRRIHARPLSPLELPASVAALVRGMSAAGIRVAYASDGNGGSRPVIELAGPYYGVWFRYWFEERLPAEPGDLLLPWAIRQAGDGSCRLTLSPGTAARHTPPDRLQIQDDAARIGEWLDRHARKIRELRRTLFKCRSMKR